MKIRSLLVSRRGEAHLCGARLPRGHVRAAPPRAVPAAPRAPRDVARRARAARPLDAQGREGARGEGRHGGPLAVGGSAASSIPPLAALLAARLQGVAREEALRTALRQAALFRGVNVSRSDVVRARRARRPRPLALRRRARDALDRARVRARYEEAVDRGVDAAPALVVGEEWLVAGRAPSTSTARSSSGTRRCATGSPPRASCTDGHRTARATECACPRARRARPHLALRACPRDLRGFPAASSLGMRVANTLRDRSLPWPP